MKQILHILYKDVRRFRLEVLVSIILLAVFTWISPILWRQAFMYEGHCSFYTPVGRSLIELLLLFLIPISWWLFIGRIVHEERLVGDRQFWITRPYEWQKLLGAKMLLVACCVYLPLAAAHWWLLQDAGLHPATHIGALLYGWLAIAAFLILPLAALAAVTRNFARMTLTLVGILVFAAAAGAIAVDLLQKGVAHSPVEHNNPFDIPILLVICAVVIVLAYRTRRIATARVFLFALPVLLTLISVLLSSDAMINRDYPDSRTAGIQIALKDNAAFFETAHPALSDKELLIQIPIVVSGIAAGDLWVGKGVRVTVESGGSVLWRSAWQTGNEPFLTANADTSLDFRVDRSLFDRIKSQPVTLRLELALDQARRAQVQTFPASLQDFDVPGLGVCSAALDPTHPETINGRPTPVIAGLNCMSALRDPEMTDVQAEWTHGPCEQAKTPGESQLTLRGAWIGNLNGDPNEFSIAPIKVLAVTFPDSYSYVNTNAYWQLLHICPGAPITFTRYGLLRQLRTEFTIENFRFPSYDKREDEAR